MPATYPAFLDNAGGLTDEKRNDIHRRKNHVATDFIGSYAVHFSICCTKLRRRSHGQGKESTSLWSTCLFCDRVSDTNIIFVTTDIVSRFYVCVKSKKIVKTIDRRKIV